MLAKIAPRFVISRVIQTSYYAQYMAVELTKQIIGESGISFYFDDPKKYFVLVTSYRNATFMDFYRRCRHPRSLLISFRQNSTIRLSRSWLYTTMSRPSSLSLMSSRWRWGSFTAASRLATPAPTSSQGPATPTRYHLSYPARLSRPQGCAQPLPYSDRLVGGLPGMEGETSGIGG